MRKPITRQAALRQITDALVEAQDGDQGLEYQRGYVAGLRVAYLLAGGESDGSKEGWAAVRARKRPSYRPRVEDRRLR